MSVVDQIREQLSRNDGLTSESMEPLALEYGLEVSAVNERLGKCTHLLRKGLRSEAIQLANIRPNLFEWSASLDFPEVGDWLEILQFFQIALPQRLNLDAVQQLQEAMVEEQPLAELMRQHRRLAIGKAPLSWRLKVLRAIANVNTSNAMWSEDLEVWERARLSEIPHELNRSIKEKDFDTCAKLAQELNQPNWIVRPPQELISAAVTATNRFEYRAQCKELESVGKSLYDSFCTQDKLQCQTFGAQWNKLTAQLKGPVPKTILESAEPALLWLAELNEQEQIADSFRQSVELLTHKLNEGLSILEIQKAYQVAASFGHDLDPTLEARYRSVTSELALTARRKTILAVVGITSAAVLAALAFGFWQWQSAKQRELTTSITTMRQLLEGRKLQEAKDFIDKLQTTKPSVAKSTEMMALASDLSGKVQAEVDRVSSFESYVKAADHESPEQIDLANLVRAEELAATEGEKERIYRIRRKRQEYDRAQEDEQFAQLSSALPTVVEALDAIENKPIDQIVVQDFEQPQNQLADLVRKYPNVGSAGNSLVETVHKRMTTLRDAHSNLLLKRQNEQRALNAIRNARTLEAHRQALLAYANAAPGSSISAEFKEAAGESDNWTIINDWNGFVSSLDPTAGGTTPESSKKLAEDYGKLRGKLEDCTALARCPDLDLRLERVARRPEALRNLQSTLNQELVSAFVTLQGQLQSEPDKAIRVFAYFNQLDSKRNELENASARAGNGLEVVTGSDGTVKVLTFRGPVKVVDQPKAVYEEMLTTLQLRAGDIANEWETALLLMINDIMKKPQVDSAVKEMLIVQVLEAATFGSYYLHQKLNDTLVFLKQKRLRDVRWFEPRAGRDGLEPQTETRLRTALGEAYRNIATSNQPIAKLAASKLTWVGSVQRDDNGRMHPWLYDVPSIAGSLNIVVSSSKAGLVKIEEVGQVNDGSAKLNQTSPSLMAGRPLFFMPID